MAKINGLFGSMSGKLADTVMVVRNGVQIARKYQPYVQNPKSQSQAKVRARLKLMSQVSAVLSPLIAFRRDGLVSPRNKFTASNFPKTSYSEDAAHVDLLTLDLTGGLTFCSVTASRDGSNLNLQVGHDISDSRVVYGVFSETASGLRLLRKGVADTASGTTTSIPVQGVGSSRLIVYAFTMRDNTEKARIAYGNLSVPKENVNAFINVMRYLTEDDISLSATAAAEVTAAQ